jgi:hypothetical protein
VVLTLVLNIVHNMMFLVFTNEYSCSNSVALYLFGLCLMLRFRVRVRIWVMLNLDGKRCFLVVLLAMWYT